MSTIGISLYKYNEDIPKHLNLITILFLLCRTEALENILKEPRDPGGGKFGMECTVWSCLLER